MKLRDRIIHFLGGSTAEETESFRVACQRFACEYADAPQETIGAAIVEPGVYNKRGLTIHGDVYLMADDTMILGTSIRGRILMAPWVKNISIIGVHCERPRIKAAAGE